MDRLSKGIGWIAIRGLRRDLKGLNATLQAGIDTYRQVHNLDPLFSQAAPAPLVEDSPGEPSLANDWQRIGAIEELAAEERIPLTNETDLAKLAISRGWMSPEGQMLKYPQSMIGRDVMTGDRL